MQPDLKSKKIIVTGASSGIGKHLCAHIAKNGGIPIMLARSLDKLEDLRQQLYEQFAISAPVYQIDLTTPSELDAVIKQVLLEHTQVSALINNAGIGVFDYITEMKSDDINRMFQLNVFAVMQLTKSLVPHFLQHEEGHIINIVSQAGKIATPKSAGYAASKHAVLGFTNALRLELSGENIYVTAVNPGPVRTDFFQHADPEGTYQKSVEAYMLDPDKTAKKIVSKLFTNKRELNMPWWMELGSRLYSMFPGGMERLLQKQFHKK